MTFDKKIISKNFSRAAKNYDDLAQVQNLAARELVDLLRKNSELKYKKILDLGSGTGFVAKEMLRQAQHDDAIKITETDISAQMLECWLDRPKNVSAICADFENLPFEKNSFDIITSSFSLQWLSEFEKNFSRFFALLKPHGIFAFCLPVAGSLEELQKAGIFNFNALPDPEKLRATLKKSGFSEKSFFTKSIKQEFANPREALKSLKKIGANHTPQKPAFISKAALKHFDSFCLKNSAANHKNFTVSWEISFFILSKNHDS